jgi:hypothetical protein
MSSAKPFSEEWQVRLARLRQSRELFDENARLPVNAARIWLE